MVKNLTLSEQAYISLRDSILSGEIIPGNKINLKKAATILNISATPVREALTKLQQDNLVRYIPNAGWKVAKISRIEFLKYRELQLLLENTLAERALPYVTDETIKSMEEANNRMCKAVEDLHGNELGRVLQAENDNNFHLALYRLYNNEPMVNTLKKTWDAIKYQRMIMFMSSEFSKICCSDHDMIISALKKKNIFLLQEALNRHWASGPMCLEDSFDDTDEE